MAHPTGSNERILTRLRGIEQEEGVRILYACESGSRAWGFESRDSDYDVRFLYAHPEEWYLSIDVERRPDVIGRPITDEIDLSGWDLRKALQLLAGSNVTLVEWLRSPVVYCADRDAAARLRKLADVCYSPRSAFYYYFNMARSISGRYLGGETVRLKRYFYMLRPVLACRWIASGGGMPPLAFERLVDAELSDEAVLRVVRELLGRKRRGDELDEGPRLPVIDAFIHQELERFEEHAPHLDAVRPDPDALNWTFRSIVRREGSRSVMATVDQATSS